MDQTGQIGLSKYGLMRAGGPRSWMFCSSSDIRLRCWSVDETPYTAHGLYAVVYAVRNASPSNRLVQLKGAWRDSGSGRLDVENDRNGGQLACSEADRNGERIRCLA